MNQLCDRGALGSLGVVQESIRKSWSGPRGEGEIEFCKARMRAVVRDPDRIKALGSVLNMSADNDRLVRWAIYQLMSMHSPNANAELDRFVNEIGKLPEWSPDRRRLGIFRQEIQDIRARK